MSRSRSSRLLVGCLVVVMVASTALVDAAASASSAASPSPAHGDAVAAKKKKKKKKKKCRKGYKLVTVKVKRKKRGKRITVKVKKCRKAKVKKKVVLPPAGQAPSPSPVPAPSPSPASPKIDSILGWSTIAQDPDTPPADLTADGGTITSCPSSTSLSVYLRRSGFTFVGQVGHVWKRDGAVIASGSNSSTFNGAFRHGITISAVNGVYEIVWTYAGSTIGAAKVTRNC